MVLHRTVPCYTCTAASLLGVGVFRRCWRALHGEMAFDRAYQ